MTRKIAAGVFAAAFGLAVSAGAQTPPSSPQTPPANPPASPTSPYPSAQAPSADRAGKDTKLTGCVAAGTAANSFELTNVKKGAMSSDKAGATVKLSGGDLAAHVGHTVEVTGSWAKAGDTSSAAPADASAAPKAKEFSVTAVKMVSATCSAGTN